MYCPKCNLHSEEYVDKCPLCNGPMEVDEVASGVMKTPTLPDKERTEELPGEESFPVAEEKDQEGTDIDTTVTLEADQARILAEVEQERLQIEESEGKEETPQAPPPQEEESFFEQKEPSYEEEPPPTPEPSGRKRLPLFLGGGILILLILAVLGYFLFSPPDEPSKVAKTKVAVPKKKARRAKPSAPRKKASAAIQEKKKAETKLKELKMAETSLPFEKAEPLTPAKTDEGTAIQKGEPLTSLSEKKEPGLPAGLEETTPPESKATEPEPTTLTAISPKQRPTTTTVTEPKKTLSEPPGASLAFLPSSSEEGPYSVHVGSFRSQDRAFALRDRLQDKGYPVLCSLVTIPGKGDWYRVKVGYYSSLEDVHQVVSKLKTEEKVPTLILKRK